MQRLDHWAPNITVNHWALNITVSRLQAHLGFSCVALENGIIILPNTTAFVIMINTWKEASVVNLKLIWLIHLNCNLVYSPSHITTNYRDIMVFGLNRLTCVLHIQKCTAQNRTLDPLDIWISPNKHFTVETIRLTIQT